jgi:hypothetical protein
MNIDLATQVVIGHNFFLSSAWTGDDGQPRKKILFPRKCTQQIFNNQIDQQPGWGRIAKHPGSSSPPCPQAGGVSLSEVGHFPYGFPSHSPVQIQGEGSLSGIGLFPLKVSFPLPCPNPRGGVSVRNRTFYVVFLVISSPCFLMRLCSS